MTPLRLVRPLGAGEPAPAWPEGIRLVPFTPEDARATHALLEAGYRPDLIVTEADEISDAALRCGGVVIAHTRATARSCMVGPRIDLSIL